MGLKQTRIDMDGKIFIVTERDGYLESVAGTNLRQDTFYILCPYGIGDTLFTACLVRAFKWKIKANKVCLIVKEGHSQIPDWFDAVDEKIVSQELVSLLNVFSVFTETWNLENYLYAHLKKDKNWQLIPQHHEYWAQGFDMIDWYKKLVFHLPDSCPIEPPKIRPQTALLTELMQRYRIDKQTAILMPYANSLPLLTESIWENIADSLLQKGYTVFTNQKAGTNEHTIKGTIPLCADLATTAALCEKCGVVIAHRSGICDVLAFTDSNLKTVDGISAYEVWPEFSAISGQINGSCIVHNAAHNTVANIGQQSVDNVMCQAVELFDQQQYRAAFAMFAGLFNSSRDGVKCQEIFHILNDAFYAPNEEELRNIYELNSQLLKEYPYFINKNFQEFSNIDTQLYPVDDQLYYCYNRKSARFWGEYDASARYSVRFTFNKISGPLILIDPDNLNSLSTLTDRLPMNDRHVYLLYSSMEPLERLMQTCSLEQMLQTKQLIFLVGESNWGWRRSYY